MKEYFTSTYEQTRKNKLIEINNTYNELLNTYESATIQNKNESTNELYDNSNEIMNELDEYLTLIEKQMNMLEEKKVKLSDIENKIIELKSNRASVNFNKNLEELKMKNDKDRFYNIFTISNMYFIGNIIFFFCSSCNRCETKPKIDFKLKSDNNKKNNIPITEKVKNFIIKPYVENNNISVPNNEPIRLFDRVKLFFKNAFTPEKNLFSSSKPDIFGTNYTTNNTNKNSRLQQNSRLNNYKSSRYSSSRTPGSPYTSKGYVNMTDNNTVTKPISIRNNNVRPSSVPTNPSSVPTNPSSIPTNPSSIPTNPSSVPTGSTNPSAVPTGSTNPSAVPTGTTNNKPKNSNKVPTKNSNNKPKNSSTNIPSSVKSTPSSPVKQSNNNVKSLEKIK